VTSDNALRIGEGCAVAGRRAVARSGAKRRVSYRRTHRDGAQRLGRRARHGDRTGSLAGLVRAIEDTSIFMSHEQKSDALGNSVGFAAYDGALSPDFAGRFPFQFAAPMFVATNLRVTIAREGCGRGRMLARSGRHGKRGKVNLWIPDNGSQYAAAGKGANVEGIGSPATLIVNRDLATTLWDPVVVRVSTSRSRHPPPTSTRILEFAACGDSAATAESQPVQIVEYYNPGLDHYFITWLPDEIGKLDDGSIIRGWQRTGRDFRT
jgi:hypothetical protein